MFVPSRSLARILDFGPKPFRRVRRPARTRLNLELLEDRVVPTVLDLSTAPGLSGMLPATNGAIFTGATGQNTSGSGVIDSLVQVGTNAPIVQGFNTDNGTPLDDQRGMLTHSLRLLDLPVVVQGTTTYYEFALDINQNDAIPDRFLSLDELRIYVTTPATPNPSLLDTYNPSTLQLNGLAPVYDMDGGPDPNDETYVKLNYDLNKGSGTLDLFVDVPTANFGGADPSQYVYLYSKFGVQNANNDGPEVWVRGKGGPLQLSAPLAAAINAVGSPSDTGVTSVPNNAVVYETTTVTPPSGGAKPTGTVTYYFYNTVTPPILGRDTPVWTHQVTLNNNGTVPNSQNTAPLTGPGNYWFLATYSGDSTYRGTVSSIEPLLVRGPNQSPTAITTTVTPASGTVGSALLQDQAVLSGSLSSKGKPTGTITFTLTAPDNTTQTYQVTVNDFGTYSAPTSPILATQAGTYEWVASYSGDTNYSGAFSNFGDEPVTVSKVATTTTVTSTSTANVSVLSQAVTFTATVIGVGGTPTSGTVTFLDNGNSLGSSTVNGSGVANFTTSALTVGSHTITAVFNGSGGFTVSTSAALIQTVMATAAQSNSTSGLVYNDLNGNGIKDANEPGLPGVRIHLNILAGSGVPERVTTTDVNGLYLFANITPPGTYVVLEDVPAGLAATSANPLTLSINSGSILSSQNFANRLATTTTVTSSANASVAGQAVTFTATVSGTGSTPTGTVALREGSTTLGTSTLNASGVATFTLSTLSVGSHPITALYNGDTTFAPSTSATLAQTVNRATTTTTVTSSANPAVVGQPVTFTATVAAVPGVGTPTGTVTFTIDGTARPAVTLAGGQATLAVTTLTVGSHTISAAYSSDSNFNTSTSQTLTQTVAKANTTTTLASSANPSVFGQTVTYTATVAAAGPGAGAPTGTATFTVDGTARPAVTLAGGQATLAVTNLTVGSHTISAAYSGDSNFAPSTSANLTQMVTVTLVTQSGPPQPLSFYTSKSGQQALTGSQTGTTLMSSITSKLFGAQGQLAKDSTNSVLVGATGYVPLSSFSSYSFVSSYLLGAATASNMAYQLSAQLLTAEFNVVLGKLDTAKFIYVPAVTIPSTGQLISSTLQTSLQTNGVSSAGVAKIQDILNAAIAVLKRAPNTTTASADRDYEEALKDCLDGINNNEKIFLA